MRPPDADVPQLPGLVDAAAVRATGAAIARAQESSGAIPWFAGGHVDAWDHVECAMALSVTGLIGPAVAAYDYLRRTQRRDGSWPARVTEGAVDDPGFETNHCAYVAVGVLHHLLVTDDLGFAHRMWPTVRSALDLVTGLATERGEIAWAVDAAGVASGDGLLTGSSSTYHALRCGLALADRLGDSQPEWELAAGRLAHVVAAHPEAFLDKDRYSMDWYYPILGGAVRGPAAGARLADRWREFVVPGLGIRCVSDQPWVTGAETCELVLALDCIDAREQATALLADIQHLRHADGSYWTGYQYVEDINWPDERSTWTGAAVVLAVDALARGTPGNGIFRGDDLPVGMDLTEPTCGCTRVVSAATHPSAVGR